MDIGKTISKLRNCTQQELSKKCGISQTSLSQIENGRKRPSEKNLARIASALGASPLQIYLLSFEINDVPESKRALFLSLEKPLKELMHLLINKN